MIEGLIIDSFAGGGGASLGIERALGRPIDVAINHDAEALAMHEANHPKTLHIQENVWKVDPAALINGRQVGILWSSPDCRHHSKAKGGAPVSRSVRGLADVVLVWAKVARPQIIILENVEEFRDWGPLKDGRPCPDRRGADFIRWVRGLENEGYEVEWKLLRACDYGAPTIRRRLYLVARRDGHPIIWPAPTHGDPATEAVRTGAVKPWRTAAEIIDWSLPCPSIFLMREDARAAGLRVQRPLAPKTLARIARGFRRYVLDRRQPFIVVANHGGDHFRGQGLCDPFCTVTASRDAYGVVTPYLVPRYQEREGQEPRTRGADQPCATVVPGGNGPGSLIAPFLGVWRADNDGRAVDQPAPTVTANSFMTRPGGAIPLGVITPFMSYAQQGGQSRPADEPHSTVTASTKDQNQVILGYLAQHNGNGVIGRAADEPLSTVTQCAAQQMPVVASVGYMATLKGKSTGSAPDEPVVTVHAGGGHHAVVLPHLSAYYQTDQAPELDRPAPTATTHDRFARVDAAADAPPLAPWQLERARQVADFLRAHGVWDGGDVVTIGPFIVWDIGMRMLTPRELARAQGFPDSYVLAAPFEGGALTETAQRARIGNSVCPDMAEALVRANAIDALAMPLRRRRRAAFAEPPRATTPTPDPGLFTEAAE